MSEQPIRKLNLVKASTVRMEKTNWLKHNFIPCRSLTLLAGREGIGKSLIACDYVAQATRGELDNGEPLNCLYLHTEDSRSATVTPRIRAAGADMERVFFLDVTVSYENQEIGAALELPRDFEALEQVIKDKHIGVVVLDAAKSSMSAKIDGNRDDSVRQVLDPMNRIGDKTNCAFIGLVHFGKRESSDTGKLITGSIAWSQVARSVLSVAKDEEKNLLVTNTKHNLADAEITEMAHIESATVVTDDGATSVGRIVWDGQTTRHVSELLQSHDDSDGDQSDAEQWLEDFLTEYPGSTRANVFKAALRDRVASEATLKRAFKALGGISKTSGFPRVARWSLPPNQSAQVPPYANTCEPTEPTELDLHKRNDPTGENTQLDHGSMCEPTGDPTGEIVTPPLFASEDDCVVCGKHIDGDSGMPGVPLCGLNDEDHKTARSEYDRQGLIPAYLTVSSQPWRPEERKAMW